MKGFWKFVLGGLLGAAFGFFLAPKHAQRVRDALTGAGGPAAGALLDRPAAPSLYEPVAFEPVPPVVDVVEPEPVAEPAEPVAEVAKPEPEPEPAAVVEPESVAEPKPEPVGGPITEEVSAPNAFEITAVLPVETDAWASEDEPTLEEEQPSVIGAGEEAAAPEEDALAEEATAAEDHASPPLDLRARIEETRRRIQEELERPFAAAVPVGVAPAEEESSEHDAPPADDADAQEEESREETVAPAWVAPAWPSPPSAEVVEVESPVELAVGWSVEVAEEWPLDRAEESPFEPAEESVAKPATSVAAAGDFDRDAMRLRIEATRNRLKAKAFDAMMSGESALLARDGGAAPETGARSSEMQVDSEVDETIEKTLSEEDV